MNVKQPKPSAKRLLNPLDCIALVNWLLSTILNIALCTGALPPIPPNKCTEDTKNSVFLTLQ